MVERSLARALVRRNTAREATQRWVTDALALSSLDELAEHATLVATRVFRCSISVLYLLEGQELVLAGQAGLSSSAEFGGAGLPGYRIPLSQSYSGRAVLRGDPVLRDEQGAAIPERFLDFEPWLRGSLALCPLSFNRQPLGALQILRPASGEGPLGQEELESLVEYGAQVAFAIMSQRLVAERTQRLREAQAALEDSKRGLERKVLERTMELEALARRLQADIVRRKEIEEELRQAQDLLERRVEERTAALSSANQRLRAEVADRQAAERALRASQGRMQRNIEALLELARHEGEQRNLEGMLRALTETSARTLGVQRVGIWLFDEDRTTVRCLHLYRAPRHVFEPGCGFPVERYPKYFAALARERTLAAREAQGDPRTAELLDDYLRPLRIASKLDATIRLGGRTVGVVSHDHVGEQRSWALDQCSFAGSIADMISLALEEDQRRRTREAHTQLTEQLLRSQKMEALGRLAGGVAHDFNNLLTTILGYADLVASSLSSEDPRREDLEEVLRAGQRGSTLTRQLLAFSRKQVAEPRALQLNDVIAQSRRMLARTIGEDVNLVFRPGEDLASVWADIGQVDQVLLNLVINARDAMPEGGSLTLETRNVELGPEHSSQLAGQFVCLSVSDTGVGMDEDTRRRVFEPFFTTKGQHGTGLGLSTVYGIIEQAGGFIELRSSPGAGTRFELYLPRLEAKPEVEVKVSLPGPELKGSGTVLLAEDEATVRGFAARVLRRHGYHVVEACNGEEALECWRSPGRQIDLLLSDVVMPRMGGVELARRLRSLEPELPVVLVSGYSQQLSFEELPDTWFVEKPLSGLGLLGAVRRALTRVSPSSRSGTGRHGSLRDPYEEG